MAGARSGLELAVEAVCAVVALMVAFKVLPPAKRTAFLKVLKWAGFAVLAVVAFMLGLVLLRGYLHPDR